MNAAILPPLRDGHGASTLSTMTTLELLALFAIGLVSGALGGLLGIGGSIVMIPAITLLLGRNIHLVQAAAMIINFFVAVPATVQHHRAGAVDWRVVYRILPVAIAFIIAGVLAGNTFDGSILEKLFAVFLIYVVFINVRRLVKRRSGWRDEKPKSTGWWRVSMVGGVVGFMAGMLGIGGGTVTVPLFQRVCHMPLRQAIATSSAVMCLTAVFGAVMKNATLHTHDVDLALSESLLIAACLAPTAVVGGWIGAHLTHRLPVEIVRVALILLLIAASIKMMF